jgi:predicted O-methyltransferase YrrM
MKTNVFERYPQLATLRGKVPDEIVEREVEERVARFKEFAVLAKQAIPNVWVSQVFPPEAEQGQIVLEKFLGQWGNITVEEVCKIALIAAWLKPRSVFEFGTYNGMTTFQLALNTPADCKIYTLDVQPDQSSELNVGAYDRCLVEKKGTARFDVGHYFAGTNAAAKITQLWGDSSKIDLSAYHKKVDLVFVDAAHTYPYVKSDTENALKLLRPGGVILWHDYLQLLHADVTQALYEFARAGMCISHLRGTSLAVYRDKN